MDWNSSIKGFKAYLMLELSLSKRSIEAYMRDVGKFVEYLQMQEEVVAPENITLKELQDFLSYIGKLGLAASSQARLISGLKAFYKYLLIEDIVVLDPTELLEAPRLSRKIPDVLSYEEVGDILAAIDLSHPQGHRNRAMIEVLYACGLRVSELVNLKLTNLHLEVGFLKVVGKSNKERFVPIGEEAIKQLNFYIDQRKHDTPKPGEENIVFLNRRGKRLTREMVYMIVKQLVKLTDITKKVSPHTFRHSFATHLIEGGADLKVIQDMLGHESILTTEIYTHLDKEYLKDTILTFHPRNRKDK